jgi:nicotinate dehydrogenase subunit B
MNNKPISRRQLLKGSGALVVGFSMFRSPLSLLSQDGPAGAGFVPDPLDYLDPRELDSWLAVMQDGSITVFTGKVDLGTGIETALAQIVAEELDVPFGQIRMKMGDTAKTVDQGRTAGSNTIQGAGPQLRQAAAAGRLELVKMASARLQIPAEKLTVTDGVVSAIGDPSKKISYADIIGGKRFNVKVTATGRQGALKVAPEVKPKSYKDYKIVGMPVPRVDLAPKLTGEYPFTPDVRVPGMLHGRVLRPANVISTKPANVDESSIRNIPGIVKVVKQGSFVGVVAETEWAAVQAAAQLKVTWATPASKLPANRDEIDAYLRQTKIVETAATVAKAKDVEKAFSEARKTVEASYHWPFQNHAMMGPSCAVADAQGDQVTIWTGAQGPFTTRDRVASMMQLPKRKVDVRWVESSGCYGRLTADDAAEDAVLLSRAVGKPVRVQWSRADEHVWEPKGPQQLFDMRAALDAQGMITAWDSTSWSFPWTEAQGTPQLGERQSGLNFADPDNGGGGGGGGGGAAPMYDVALKPGRGANAPWPQDEPTPLRTGPLRSPGEPARVFAVESFMDELAMAAGMDPVQFRLRHIKSNKRVTEALLAAAEKAGWKDRVSPAPVSKGTKAIGRGVATTIWRGTTILAAIAEVEVDRSTGKVTVKKVTISHDCGLIVNPNGLRMQIDGNVMQGVSRVLLEEVRFDASGAKTVDWQTYPVLRFRDVPEVETVLINRPEIPSSGGAECSVVVVPAAVANAVFDAIGVRFREVPLTPDRVLSGLKAKLALAQKA